MSKSSEKEIEEVKESMRRLQDLLFPPKKPSADEGADFLKDLFNMKEKK